MKEPDHTSPRAPVGPTQVAVLLFAGARDAIGSRCVDIALPEGATTESLMAHLAEAYPAFGTMARIAQAAVNEQYVPRTHILKTGDEVAIIPPVSGGSDSSVFRVVERAIDPGELHEVVRSSSDGAVVTFSGVVRDHSRNAKTSHLFYEAYAPMAEKKMASLASEARTKWPVGDIGMVHRVGKLEIGEISILLSVASPHRGEAFDAARFLIDRLKDEVPIWKKEFGSAGEYWVEGPGDHVSATAMGRTP